MATIKLVCPNSKCLARYKVDEAHAGKRFKCKKCGATLVLLAEDREQDKEPVYPWEPRPLLLARAEAYEKQGKFQSYPANCREELNYVGRNNIFASSFKAEMHVYPDMVGVVLPGRVGSNGGVVSLIVGIVMMCLGAFLYMMGVALEGGLLVLLIGIPIAIFATICLSPFIVLYGLAAMLYGLWENSRLPQIAERIRANPKSSYAVRKMRKLAGLVPRFWRKGDVAEIIRADVLRPIPPETRRAILVAQGDPIPRRPGWTESLTWLASRRRVYLVWMKDAKQADAAAAAVARVLAVPLTKVKITARDTLKET